MTEILPGGNVYVYVTPGPLLYEIEVYNTDTGKVIACDNVCDLENAYACAAKMVCIARGAWRLGFTRKDLIALK